MLIYNSCGCIFQEFSAQPWVPLSRHGSPCLGACESSTDPPCGTTESPASHASPCSGHCIPPSSFWPVHLATGFRHLAPEPLTQRPYTVRNPPYNQPRLYTSEADNSLGEITVSHSQWSPLRNHNRLREVSSNHVELEWPGGMDTVRSVNLDHVLSRLEDPNVDTRWRCHDYPPSLFSSR